MQLTRLKEESFFPLFVRLESGGENLPPVRAAEALGQVYGASDLNSGLRQAIISALVEKAPLGEDFTLGMNGQSLVALPLRPAGNDRSNFGATSSDFG